jgi:hypothetical protein
MITLPVIAVVTPVASLAAGDLLLGESARLGVLSGAVAALAVLVALAGLVLLARLATRHPAPAGGQGSSVILPAFAASGSRPGPDPAQPAVRPQDASHPRAVACDPPPARSWPRYASPSSAACLPGSSRSAMPSAPLGENAEAGRCLVR